MGKAKGKDYYIELVSRFVEGETLDEIAGDLALSKSRIRSSIQRGIGYLLWPHRDGEEVRLIGFEEWEGQTWRPDFRFVRSHKEDIERLLEGNVESNVKQRFKYKTIIGYLRWSKTVKKLNKAGAMGWEVVSVTEIGESYVYSGKHRIERKKVEFLLKRRL